VDSEMHTSKKGFGFYELSLHEKNYSELDKK
jgi:hypothetical protein